MSPIPKISRTKFTRTSIAGLVTLGVAGAGALSVAQQQMPPGQPPDRDRDREVTHTAIVVDLSTDLEKQAEDSRGQPGRRGMSTQPDDPPARPPVQPARDRDREQEEDCGIDWTAGEYSHEELMEKAGEEVEVSGEIHKRGAIRGLCVFHIDRVH